MASIDDLKGVLKDSLDKKGSLNQIKAKLRAEIYSTIEDNNEQIPKIPHENLIINELIREYLEFNEYKYTNSVFLKETGQPANVLSKELVMTELGIKENQITKQMPLIYSLVWHFLNNDEYLGEKTSNTNTNATNSNSNIEHRQIVRKIDEDDDEPKINIYKYKTEYE